MHGMNAMRAMHVMPSMPCMHIMNVMSFMHVHAYCVHACLDMPMHACHAFHAFTVFVSCLHRLRTEAPTVGICHDLSGSTPQTKTRLPPSRQHSGHTEKKTHTLRHTDRDNSSSPPYGHLRNRRVPSNFVLIMLDQDFAS